MHWKPNVTVAAVAEEHGKFLLVDECINGEQILNQPAGHLEYGESLVEVVKRETMEETGYQFTPEFLLGIYQWQHPQYTNLTYLRFVFSGKVFDHNADYKLDDGIIGPLWLTKEDIITEQARHRSPQLLLCVNDYIAGIRYPMDLLRCII